MNPALRWRTPLLMVALGLLLSSAAQAATVQVRFVEPERYADAGRDVRSREETRTAIAVHLRKLGATLDAAQTLQIEVLDIDLAGEIDPSSRRWPDIRVMRGRADWPRIQLRYTLLAGDQVVSRGEEWIADMSYMMSARASPADEGQAFGYEKAMLTRWFNERFGKPR